MNYSLSSFWLAHGKDVRGITTTHSGCIMSVSRDHAMIEWEPIENSAAYYLKTTYNGHQHFVSSVATYGPSPKYPTGFVVSGSNDKTAIIYELGNPEPLFRLIGHENAVSALACCMNDDETSIITATCSWDKSVKVWKDGKCLRTLKGHEAAVWGCCFVGNKQLWTCSADKTVKVWNLQNGALIKTLTGHEDAVRGLIYLPSDNVVASCSNDMTIRIWSITNYESQRVLVGHNNYIYSICEIKNAEGVSQGFVTCGEDRNCKIWRNFECAQTIVLPVESVWSVGCIRNNSDGSNGNVGDIVLGCSDAKIRVFTNNPTRVATPEVQQQFDQEISESAVSRAAVGNIRKEDIPGPEGLSKPGNRDGQQKMIKQLNGKVELHTWDAAEMKWQYVGEVVEGVGSGAKQNYQGKEYDYVFDIDIGEGVPPLKLPYNVTEDPWIVAKNFLEKNEMSMQFLEQTAKFIITNTGGTDLGGPQEIGNCDPFTNGSLNNNNNENNSTNSNIKQSLFPLSEFVFFQTFKMDAILKKITELNNEIDNEDDKKLTTEELQDLHTCYENFTPDKHLGVIAKLFEWDADKLFPIMDFARVLVLNQKCAKAIAENGLITHIMSFLANLAALDKRILFLGLRFLTNCFKHKCSKDFCTENMSDFLPAIAAFSSNTDNSVSLSLATAVLNYSIALSSMKESGTKEECKLQCVCIVLEFINRTTSSSETLYRSILALGTLVVGDKTTIETANSLDVSNTIKPLLENDTKKIAEATQIILQILM